MRIWERDDPRPRPADRGLPRPVPEPLGVDLATVSKAAAKVEPYLCLDSLGTSHGTSHSVPAKDGS